MISIWKIEDVEEYMANKSKEIKTLRRLNEKGQLENLREQNKVDRIIRHSRKQRTKIAVGSELKNQEMTRTKSFLCSASPKECESEKKKKITIFFQMVF